MKFLIFISAFLLAPPFFEIFSAFFNPAPTTGSDIYLYFICILISTIVAVAVATMLNKKATGDVEKYYFSFPSSELLAVGLIGLASFLFFIRESVSGYTLIDFVAFSEGYRNGVYKGSGLYTVLLLHVLPTMLALNIAFGDKFNRVFYFCLLLVGFCTLILGLRIYLLKLFLAFLFRISIANLKFFKILGIAATLFVFLASYKFLLGSNDESDKNIVEYLLNPLTRLNFTTLAKIRFGHGLDSASCLIPTFQYMDYCDGELLKFKYFSGHSEISTGFPNLSKYSGIAMPLPVYLFNTIGFFSIFPIVFILLLTKKIYTYVATSGAALFRRSIALVFLTALSSALVEDFLFLRTVDISIGVILIFFAQRGVRSLIIFTQKGRNGKSQYIQRI